MNPPNAGASGDQPEPAVQRGAVNVDNAPFEEVMTFLLDAADMESQPVLA